MRTSVVIGDLFGKSPNKQFNETLEAGQAVTDRGSRCRGEPEGEALKFVLEVEMNDTAFYSNAERELSRILRYWAGNLKHYELRAGARAEIYDSSYAEVGAWSIVEPG